MRNRKYLVIILIFSLALILSLCACLPNATQPCEILLTNDNFNIGFSFGKFKLASISNDEYSKKFEILPKDKEDFVKFLQNSEYYIGTFKISDESYYLSKIKRCEQFNGGDECMWFASQGYVWIGKFYANKFYYLAHFSTVRLSNEFIWLDLTEAIFANGENQKELGKECKSALTWDQLKKIYSAYRIDEGNCSIELDCNIFYNENAEIIEGKTFLYFNKETNTFRVLDEYYIEA